MEGAWEKGGGQESPLIQAEKESNPYSETLSLCQVFCCCLELAVTLGVH